MRGAAELATQHGAYLQTHLAENREEIEKVRNQFTWAQDYTEVYEKCGLLGPRTVLGHCIHLSERERAALAAAGASGGPLPQRESLPAQRHPPPWKRSAPPACAWASAAMSPPGRN